MKRTKYQQAMDDIHCPSELIDQIKQQSKQVEQVSETDDYYIYLHKKKPLSRYVFKIAVLIAFLIPTTFLIKNAYQSFHTKNPIPSTQDSNTQGKVNHPTNIKEEDNDSSAPEDEPELDQQVVSIYLTKYYPDFQWKRNMKEDGTYYELWNDKNEIRMNINPKKSIALVEHNGKSLELSLPYGFIPTAGSGTTAMYLQDTVGNGNEQLVVISTVTGTRYSTWNLDVYDLTTMTLIPIQEDVSWLASQMNLEVLSYYDKYITYTLTVPDNTTYLMSDYIGEAEGLNTDGLKYNPLSVLTDGIDEIIEYTLSDVDLEQVTYELKQDASGLRITYSITPYIILGNQFSGKIVTDFEFDGEKFVMNRDSLTYLQPNDAINELVVDAKEYQCSMHDISSHKFSTWYLSGLGKNRLLIKLMKKAKEDPWVIDATLITNGNKIPFKLLKNKSNVNVLWSQTGDSMVISYQYEQPLPAYDKETFIVYDISKNKVVYEDALTFDSMKEAFQKQGVYFMYYPSKGEAKESLNVIEVNEKDKLLRVEYSFFDQNQYQRQGSFTYNYETGEYMELAKNYQELTDQFKYWDNNEIGGNFKELIITKLEEELRKQRKLDTEMLSYLSPFLKVTEWEEFSLIEYRENSEVYGRSAGGSYLIVWKPGYAKLIDGNGSIQVKDVVQIKEKEYIIIANDYKFSNMEGIQLIHLIDSNNENDIETRKIIPSDIPKGYSYDGAIYSDTGNISYTIEGNSIIFNNGNNEYRITF